MKTLQIKTNIRWPWCCLIFFVVSCNNVSTASETVTAQKQDTAQLIAQFNRAMLQIPVLKNGDLITRTGNDFTSNLLRNLNQTDKTYSHCGVIAIEQDTVFVYHAIGGSFNPDQKIRRDPIYFFAHPLGSNGIGIFRYPLNATEQNRVTERARTFRTIPILFDMDFDLKSHEKMYCSEFVYNCLMNDTTRFPEFHFSKLKDRAFIGIDDLILYDSCKELIRLKWH